MEKGQPKVKKNRTKFSLNAPDANNVMLMADFNNWDVKSDPMKRISNGMWEKIKMLPAGRYEYKFLVGDEWIIDPNNDQTCINEHGTQNSVITVA